MGELYDKRRTILSLIARLDSRSRRKKDAVMKKPVKTETVIDWSVADAMTDEQRRAAAISDPDAVPMTDAEWAEAPRVAIQRALNLSKEECTASFHSPIGHSEIGSKALLR
jgi:hypothetical protein